MKKIIPLTLALVLSASLIPLAHAAKTGGKAPTNSTNTVGTTACANNPGFGPGGHGDFDPTNHLDGFPTNHPVACTNLPTLNTNAATDLAARAATFYAAVAPFDTDAGGTLDATEQAALYTAVANGTVAFLGTNNARAFNSRDASNIVTWMAALYAEVATFDADKNGSLDATEQATLAAAFEADAVNLALFAPLAPHGPGGGPGKGRGHARLDLNMPLKLMLAKINLSPIALPNRS